MILREDKSNPKRIYLKLEDTREREQGILPWERGAQTPEKGLGIEAECRLPHPSSPVLSPLSLLPELSHPPYSSLSFLLPPNSNSTVSPSVNSRSRLGPKLTIREIQMINRTFFQKKKI